VSDEVSGALCAFCVNSDSWKRVLSVLCEIYDGFLTPYKGCIMDIPSAAWA